MTDRSPESANPPGSFMEVASRAGIVAATIVGLDEDEAMRLIADAGFQVRVRERDDDGPRILTADLRPGRINVRIRSGKVIEAKVG